MQYFARMFSDDLIFLARNEIELPTGVRIVERIAKELSLKINFKKCVMPLLEKTNLPTYYENFPLVLEYNYLGTWISPSMKSSAHLAKECKKADFIQRILAPLRLQGDLRFNSNMFRTLILPGIRLVGILHSQSIATEQSKMKFICAKDISPFVASHFVPPMNSLSWP